jgi:hypothetical protein
MVKGMNMQPLIVAPKTILLYFVTTGMLLPTDLGAELSDPCYTPFFQLERRITDYC